jgi:hypothetical protein
MDWRLVQTTSVFRGETMTLKSAFEALGLVSIVASLVFVGMEIRQNTVVARGETLQALGGARAAVDSLPG